MLGPLYMYYIFLNLFYYLGLMPFINYTLVLRMSMSLLCVRVCIFFSFNFDAQMIIIYNNIYPNLVTFKI